MTKSIQTLLDDNALLRQLLLEQQALLESKDSKILELNQSYQTLLEQFRLAQHHRFGRSSEVCELQGELFNEAETMAEDDTLAVDTIPESETTPPQTKEKPKRKPLPAHLPRVQVFHDIDEADKQCDCCGHQLQKMGEDISEKLEFIPAKVRVIENIRLKYSCQHCESTVPRATLNKRRCRVAPYPRATPLPVCSVKSSPVNISTPYRFIDKKRYSSNTVLK